MNAPAVTVLLVCLLLVVAALPAAADTAADLDGALTALAEGRWKDAAEAAAAVDAEGELRAQARYVLGEAKLVLGDTAAAEAAFREVLEIRPAAVPAQVGLARCLVATGKAEEALPLLERARKAAPRDADVLRVTGEAQLALGDAKEALGWLEKAQKLAKDDVLVARALVETYLVENDVPKALRAAKKIAKALPKHPMGPFLIALVLEKDGEDDEALASYEKALELDPDFLDAHKNLAILCHTMSRTYQDTERVKKAIEHYERYFELGGVDPKLEEVYQTTRSFLESSGRLK